VKAKSGLIPISLSEYRSDYFDEMRIVITFNALAVCRYSLNGRDF